MVFLLLRYWWLSASALAIPARLLVMQAAGLKFGRATCVDCRSKRWMLQTAPEYRCDACVRKRAAEAEAERLLFVKWSWSPLLNEPMPEGWEPRPAQSGFSPNSPPPPFDPRSLPVFPVEPHSRRTDQ